MQLYSLHLYSEVGSSRGVEHVRMLAVACGGVWPYCAVVPDGNAFEGHQACAIRAGQDLCHI